MPACPYTAARVSEILGQPMAEQGDCLFGDGKGVAGFGVTMSSRPAASSTYDYQREQAGKTYHRVSDIKKGDKAYIAAEELKSEAVLISSKGGYTLAMSSFGFDAAEYEQSLRALLDAISE